MSVKLSKKTKATAARKNAEALKAKKKMARAGRPSAAVGMPGKKGKSIIGQSKKKK